MTMLIKRKPIPYATASGHIVAYGDTDTTHVIQALEPVTVSVKGDTVRVDSVKVRVGHVVGTDTTWTDTTRVGGSITRREAQERVPGWVELPRFSGRSKAFVSSP